MSKPVAIRVEVIMHGDHGKVRNIPIRFEGGTNRVEVTDGQVITINIDAFIDAEPSPSPTPTSPHTVR